MISYKPFYETLLKKGITEYNLIYKQGFSANTLLSTFLYPFALRVLESIPTVSTLNTDPLLGAVFGGLMIGFEGGYNVENDPEKF